MKLSTIESAVEIWGHHQLLCVSGVGGLSLWKDGLVARQIHAPTSGVKVCLPGNADLWFPAGEPREVLFSGESFSLSLGEHTLTGVMPDPFHLLVEGPVEPGVHDSSLRVEAANGRVLVGVAERFDPSFLQTDDIAALHAARMEDIRSLPVPAGLNASGASAYRKAVMVLKSLVYSPEGIILHRWTTPERWPHRDMWLWDSVFHALGWRHLDPAMARDAIFAVFDCQHPDGFIPHRMTPQGGASTFTQPPVLAYGVEALHERDPAFEWVRELYPRLRAHLEWDLTNRDTDGAGLLEWHIEELPNCRSGESGADNSPRFDPAIPLDAVDFNAYIANEFDCMARLAPLAGRAEEADLWRERSAQIKSRINATLWDAVNGFYFDFDPASQTFHRVWASSGFMPLFCGAATEEQAAELVRHLRSGGRFDTALPVASVAPSDSTYVKDMWRGPSWLNHSWMIAEGLDRYGYAEEADRIRDRWLEIMIREHERYGTFFEYYDCEDVDAPVHLLRKGRNEPEFPHQSVHYFGWTAALYVDLCHRYRS
ncbi:MAG: trehalase family glycosidase [Kiritimatiellae bacterium]|nr:trehalase family glycosidase [Kiritimatiellia bacterium]